MSIGNHLSVDGQAFFPAMRAINNSRKCNAHGHLLPKVSVCAIHRGASWFEATGVESSRIAEWRGIS